MPSDQDKLAELKSRLAEIADLGSAGAVLGWDQATYMPSGGAVARGRQSATLSRLAHEKSVDPALGKLIDQLEPYAASLPADADDARLVEVAKRDFDKAIKVPPDYVARASAAASASYDAWTRARPANDFAAMAPHLERTIALSREYAGFFAPYAHIADPLIDGADEGMTTASVQALFAELRQELVPIVHAIAEQPAIDDRVLHGTFDEPAQIAFGRDVVERLGYDFARGRIDKTHHPFSTRFASGDVRITTRVDLHDIGQALFSTIHESGHAMYEQGVAPALDGTPLGSGTSAGVHESQSRLWENVVGRGRAFWEHFFPVLQKTFPDPFAKVPLEAFYRAINKVERSLIRTDADEVTYNLHVMMRFDLEIELLEGRLRVEGPAGGVARAHAERSRRLADRRPQRLPAGRALVWRQPRRRLPGLHHRQHPQRAVLRRCGRRPSGHPEGHRGRAVRHAPWLAHRADLPPRAQVHPGRARRARHRRADEHRALPFLPARQVWRVLPPARDDGARPGGLTIMLS